MQIMTCNFLGPCSMSMMELLAKNSLRLKTVKYIHKKLHQRCFEGS